ncbi:MAG TPA: MFS transporter [Acidimicrobiia bacterium]|nr:MFS transporter [Acidimicrobiia bacterium]
MRETAEAADIAASGQRAALVGIAGSQLLVLTLWFSASAVAPQLETEWGLTSGQTAGLTLAVQIGFVIGALVLAGLGIADVVPARKLFLWSALAGATANAALVVLGPDDLLVALTLRGITGVALAGVYPSGLKVMAGWFERGRGMALGVLVGALTVGSAGPHLIRGLGLGWEGVVVGASMLAVLGAVLMQRMVSDGPFEVSAARFSMGQIGRVVRNRGVRLSTLGYLGHMWELYAMWTWTASFLAASAAAAGVGDGFVPTATFVIIASGGAGAWVAGVLADRYGRTLVAGGAMVVSGTVALSSPLVFGAAPWLVVAVFVVWGIAVVADSAQFSAMVTETADDATRGTALTVQVALGFLLTLVTIRGVPLIADAIGWRWAFPWLALGPLLGVAAMVRLRRSTVARQLAGGLG